MAVDLLRVAACLILVVVMGVTGNELEKVCVLRPTGASALSRPRQRALAFLTHE